jgi:PTS system nitrogen regulatory IIA component
MLETSGENVKMQRDVTRVASWLQPEDILIDVDLQNASHALEVIAQAIGKRHGLDPDPIFRALSRREQAGSTGLGGGFAIPHARIGGIERPLTLLLRARHAIAFHAPDGDPVSLMLAIVVPAEGDKSDHLQLLALVAELFSQPRFRAQLDTASQTAALDDAFRAGVARLTGRPA